MEVLNTGLLVLVLAGVLYLMTKNRTPRLRSSSSSATVVMCDSSALIDGRVIEVATNGFLGGTIVVPSSVLREMQYLADNSDHDKRTRARHGLDVVHQLQAMKDIELRVLDDGAPGDGGVDERLIELCKKHGASLLTLDFNLIKVAQAEGLATLNINQLAQSLRMSYLPGEKRTLMLVQKGQDSSQAVGYLEDGTMVVVEHASKEIGSEVEIEFTRALQTQAGKMLFAKKLNANRPPAHKNTQTPTQTIQTKVDKTPAPKKPNHHANNKPKPYPKRSSSRRSPEDSLVELANK